MDISESHRHVAVSLKKHLSAALRQLLDLIAADCRFCRRKGRVRHIPHGSDVDRITEHSLQLPVWTDLLIRALTMVYGFIPAFEQNERPKPFGVFNGWIVQAGTVPDFPSFPTLRFTAPGFNVLPFALEHVLLVVGRSSSRSILGQVVLSAEDFPVFFEFEA